MLNTSSTGIRNGFSLSRCGVGMYSSTAFINSPSFSHHGPGDPASSSSNAFSAEPEITGISSPGNSYSFNRSRTSTSTSSISSGSSTMSALFRKTTIAGTPT